MFGFDVKKNKFAAVLTALAIALGSAGVPTQTALAVTSTDAEWHTLQGNNWKTTICHRTHAVTNPYRKITVSDSSVYGTSGHSNPNHDRDYTVNNVTYHVFTPSISYPSNQKFWGDIIPPQNVNRRSGNPSAIETSGMNWTAAGIAIYDGDVPGCRTMTDREFIASEIEGGATSQEIAADLNDQDPDGPRCRRDVCGRGRGHAATDGKTADRQGEGVGLYLAVSSLNLLSLAKVVECLVRYQDHQHLVLAP